MPKRNKSCRKPTHSSPFKAKRRRSTKSNQVEWTKYKNNHSLYASHYKFNPRQKYIECHHCHQRFRRINQSRFYILNNHINSQHQGKLHKKRKRPSPKLNFKDIDCFIVEKYEDYWPLRTQIDTALSRYYNQKGVQYGDAAGNGKFIAWCDLNKYDSKTILYELIRSPLVCSLIEFDPEFPTNKSYQKRTSKIYNILRYCAIDPYAFVGSLNISLNKQTQIDCGLGRFYKYNVCNTEYFDENGVGKFKQWCDENGYDTDSINDDLELGPDECCLIEFDENFPKMEKYEIYNIIKACWQNPFAFMHRTDDTFDNEKQEAIYRVCVVVDEICRFGYDHSSVINTLHSYYNNYCWTPNSNIIIVNFNQNDIDIITEYIQNNYEQSLGIKLDKDVNLNDIVPIKLATLSFMMESDLLLFIECFVRMESNNTIEMPPDISRICCFFCNCIDYIHHWSTDSNITDSNQHIFDYKQIKNPIITGRSDVLELNVLNDAEFANDVWSWEEDKKPKIYNEKDIILNIGGDLKIGVNGCIKSTKGSIFINVDGNIELTSSASIQSEIGNIYIKCMSLKMEGSPTVIGGSKQPSNSMHGNVNMHICNEFYFQSGKIKGGDIKILCAHLNTSIIQGMYSKNITSRNNLMIDTFKWVTAYRMKEFITAKNRKILKYARFQILLESFKKPQTHENSLMFFTTFI